MTGDDDPTAVLALIRAAFAGMEARIDPPSSMHLLTPKAITLQNETGEVWLIGRPPLACVFLTVKPGALYVGKLATASSVRGQGLGRKLMALAEMRARALGLPALELQTRGELTENHETFRAMGFVEVGATSHPGFDHPTSLTFRRAV
jgi:GNAT superfamily N-acetyltransferase